MNFKGLSFLDFEKWKKFPVVISEYSPATFSMRYEIFNRDNDRLLLTGETRHVFVNEKNRPSRIPEEFYDKFIAHLV